MKRNEAKRNQIRNQRFLVHSTGSIAVTFLPWNQRNKILVVHKFGTATGCVQFQTVLFLKKKTQKFNSAIMRHRFGIDLYGINGIS